MDKKAKKILFEYFWSSSGWKPDSSRRISQQDFEYAKSHGAMFDPIHVTHESLLSRASSSIDSLSLDQVSAAFAASLSSRRLELRSCLASYSVLSHMPRHELQPSECVPRQCSVCGEFVRGSDDIEDINVLNFERLKWGGVRHDQVLYAVLDLEWLQRIPDIQPTGEDVILLRTVLDAIRKLPPNVTAPSLEAYLKFLPSNKDERRVLVSILGIAGLLETPEHSGYMTKFRPFSERVAPPRRFVELSYPVCWWRAEFGLNEAAVDYWFANLLKQPNHLLEARRH